MSKNILVPMANNAEDFELVAIIDLLKRAKDIGADINVICASLEDNKQVKLDTGTIILAETTLSNIDKDNIDAIILAGGFGGMTNLKNNSKIISIIQKLNQENKPIAAFCASPLVLWEAGVLSDDFTCYPGCESGVKAKRLPEPVVVRKNIITGAGPAIVLQFVLTFIKELGYENEAREVANGILATDFGMWK